MLSPGGKWRVEWSGMEDIEAARSKNGKSRHTSNPMSKDEAHPQPQSQPDESRQPSHPSQAASHIRIRIRHKHKYTNIKTDTDDSTYSWYGLLSGLCSHSHSHSLSRYRHQD